MSIGFIGLGNMGLPMCINLIKKFPKIELFAYDSNSERTSVAIEAGAKSVSSASNLAEESPEIIFTMLPSCDVVQAVVSEILATKKSGITLVDCSTISPITSMSLHKKMESSKNYMIDAPVSGGVAGAQNSTLTFMVGSNDSTFEKVLPMLQAMGKNMIRCGGPSSGSVMKLCNNLALASQMVAISEAMNLGESLGVDVKTLQDVLNQSTAGCWSSEMNNPHPNVGDIAKNGYSGGFSSNLMLKDLGLAIAAGAEKDVCIPLGSLSKKLYETVQKRGWGENDFGVVSKILRDK